MIGALKKEITERDHHKGFLNAPVVMVEYGDFECPYCSVTAPVIERLLRKYQDDLCFIYRHFPMKNIHPHSELAAQAAEAANQQGLFWEMHDLLFKNYNSLSTERIGMMGRALNLDMNQFVYDMQRTDLYERIISDFDSGIEGGVIGTPTFYINGFQYQSSSNYESLNEAIEGSINIRNSAHY